MPRRIFTDGDGSTGDGEYGDPVCGDMCPMRGFKLELRFCVGISAQGSYGGSVDQETGTGEEGLDEFCIPKGVSGMQVMVLPRLSIASDTCLPRNLENTPADRSGKITSRCDLCALER